MTVRVLMHGAQRYAAVNKFSKPVNLLSDFIFATEFEKKSAIRILIYYSDNPISWSLVYPFFYYRLDFWERLGASVTIRKIDRFLTEKVDNLEADVVIVQPWFTIPGETLQRALARYKNRHPKATIIFQDSYAPTDIRLAKWVDDYIDTYQKKSLFKDKAKFQRSFAGDTNLTEFYGDLYGIPSKPVTWGVPSSIIGKLSLVPNFLTAPYLMKGFLGPEPTFEDRPIDLHSRIAMKGSEWYSTMRKASNDAARAIPGITITPNDRIPKNMFLSEMRQSKMCWSPFGYGELCWRDLEAFMTGAVLVKPRMDHVDTTPNLYRAGETYLPVKWDFSDLDDVVRGAVSRPEYLQRIAIEAFRRAKMYLGEKKFVDEFSLILK